MKTHNPICPFDKQECAPDMDGYLDCSKCPRYCNGVRATGAMPGLEWIYNSIKKLFRK